VAGLLADRLPLRVIYAAAVLVWSAAGAGAAFVGRFSHLLVTRQVLGIGEAFNWPCATRIVANMLPPEDRGLASGIFNSGSAAGSLLAPFIILPLAHWYGWRAAFFTIGALGTLWVALWLVVTRRGTAAYASVRGVPAIAPERPREGNRTAATLAWCRQVLLHPAFWMLLAVGVSVNPCWYFLNDWIPKYLHDQRGMSQLTAGMLTVPVFVAADLGNLVGGGLVKLLTMRGWPLRRARGATIVLAVMMIVPVACFIELAGPVLTVALIASAAFGITAILANYTACQQDFSFANVGAVAGILGMACNVFSATVNPWIGRYVDRTGSYHLIFMLVGVLPVIALVAMLTFDWLVWGRGKAAQGAGP